MDWIWIATIVVVLIVLAIASRKKKQPIRVSLFRQRHALFSPAERSFLGVLDQASAGRYRIFGKVRIADVIAPARGLDKSTWTSVFNRIKAKHFDFVLCDLQTLKVKAVIELNDRSHANNGRVERDEFIAHACSDAGLALRMVRAKRSYSLDAVKEIVNEIEIELRVDPASGSANR